MGITFGIVMQIGQPPAAAVQPIVAQQPVIEAQVISRSTKAVSSVVGARQSSPQSYQQPATYTYSAHGQKQQASALGRNLDIFA